MKNRLKMLDKKTIRKGLLIAGMLSFCGFWSTLKADRHAELDEMSFTEMINSVDVGEYSKAIQEVQDKEARNSFLKYSDLYNFQNKDKKKERGRLETYRNKEVILVTLPASFLFAPNETELKENAGKYLTHFKKYLNNNNPDLYRVLLVMHTDNTGSEQYRDKLTEERVESVFLWFDEEGCDTSYLFPYAMGDERPLVENDSQENRAINRRLEIYVMPGAKMLEQAKRARNNRR